MLLVGRMHMHWGTLAEGRTDWGERTLALGWERRGGGEGAHAYACMQICVYVWS